MKTFTAAQAKVARDSFMWTFFLAPCTFKNALLSRLRNVNFQEGAEEFLGIRFDDIPKRTQFGTVHFSKSHAFFSGSSACTFSNELITGLHSSLQFTDLNDQSAINRAVVDAAKCFVANLRSLIDGDNNCRHLIFCGNNDKRAHILSVSAQRV
ncbi:MAG: hypothetical protein GY820_47050 [Gammaproteobacteria bacterium]|nr:hypothetical protein [Gammaproteobacteria bacterium]